MSEREAWANLMEAAAGLDRIQPPASRKCRTERIAAPPEWGAYVRAYEAWIETVQS